MTANANLFVALRAAFPADLDGRSPSRPPTAPTPLHYTWRDLDRGTAMMANLLESLGLPPAAGWRCRPRRASRR
jgi:malonyl-CoA/methylmalonyl-CoA synthetase